MAREPISPKTSITISQGILGASLQESNTSPFMDATADAAPVNNLLNADRQPQFSVFGSALPGTEAARQKRRAHPLTVEAMRNYNSAFDIDGGALAKQKALAEATNMPLGLIQKASPNKIVQMAGWQDHRAILAKTTATREKMAVNREVAAILRNEIPLMYASEKATEAMRGAMLEAEPAPWLEINANLMRFRSKINYYSFLAKSALARADTAGRPVSDLFFEGFYEDEETDPLLSWMPPLARNILRTPSELISGSFEGLAKVGARLFTSEEDAERLRQEAEQDLFKIIDLVETFSGLPRSEGEKAVIDEIVALKDASLPDKILGFLDVLATRPDDVTSFATGQMIQQGPVVASGLLASRVGLGGVVSTAGGMASEFFNFSPEKIETIKEETGVDITTPEGVRALISNPAVKSAAAKFDKGRGLGVGTGQALGYAFLGRIGRLDKSSLTKFGLATMSELGTEGLGEWLAQTLSGQSLDSAEIMLEMLGGSNPSSVAVEGVIAGAGDIKRRADAKKAKAWLKGQQDLQGNLQGIPTEKLSTAADVMSDKLKEDGIDTVYIPAEEVMRFDQDGSLAETLGLESASLQEAAVEGNDVEIDTATYIRHILGKQGFEQLLEHTRFDIEGMTAREAADYETSGIAEEADNIEQQLQARALDRIAPGVGKATLNKLVEDTNKIRSTVAEQIIATGTHNDRRADLLGQLTAQRYAARAIRLTEETGQPVDALALFEADNLRIEGEQARVEAPTFEQVDRIKLNYKDVTERTPALNEAARRRRAGEITAEEYAKEVDKLKTVLPFEAVPEPATTEEMRGALDKRKKEKLGKADQIPVGQRVGLRLDIPAYRDHGVWVPTIHNTPVGNVHEAAAQITNVDLMPTEGEQRKAAQVFDDPDRTKKSPFARMDGDFQSADVEALAARAQDVINDPEWTQVGYDPERHSFFYDRSDQRPVVSAEEVIQVGPLVLAKNVQYGDAETFLFQDGSLVDAAQNLKDDPAAYGVDAANLQRVSPIYRPEALPVERLPSNMEAALWLEEQFPGTPITDFTEPLTSQQIEEIALVMAAEAQLAMENTGNASDWYSSAILRALDVLAFKYPMITDDAAAAEGGFGTASNARFVLTYIMAVTSQNLDVAANSKATDEAFGQMVEMVKKGHNHGQIPMLREWGTGDKQEAMGDNFDKFLPMVNAMPGDSFAEKLTALDALFRESKTVREWEVEMKAAGIPYSPPGQTAKDAVVYGSSTLGPKIGNGFWQNLNGNFDPLTIDLWLRRTWGRMTGKSIGNPEALPAQRDRLRRAAARSLSKRGGDQDHVAALKQIMAGMQEQIDSLNPVKFSRKKDFNAEKKRLKARLKIMEDVVPDLEGLQVPEPWSDAYANNDAELLGYAKRLLSAWNVEYNRLRESGPVPKELQPTWARAAKTIITNLSKPLDQVANGTQRKQIEAAGAKAKEVLQQRGIELTVADLQAVLWYPEKELWGALTTELATDEDGVAIVPPNPLNASYDTTFANILREQGYAVEGIEGLTEGRDGAGAVSGQDARPVEPEGVTGVGQTGTGRPREAALEQTGAQADPRGGFTPSDLITDQDDNPVNLIQIFEKADQSTFLHESGHFWLEQLKSDAAAVGGQFQRDFDIVTKWWGSRSLEIKEEAIRRAKKKKDKASVAALQKMTDAQVKAYIRQGDLRGKGVNDPSNEFSWLSIAMHENFARGVESYFATGNAPSLALADAFASFAAWIQSVYRRLIGTDIQMSDEVTAVLDRMLAADEEIAVAQGQYDLASIFDTADRAGMTDEQFNAYQQKMQRAKNQSQANQRAKHISELQDSRRKWWQEERDTYKDEVTDEIKMQPAYRLLHTLITGGYADGSQPEAHERLGPIDRALLETYLAENGMSLSDLPRIGNKAVYAKGKNLVDPGTAARMFGFEDVHEMLQALKDLPKFDVAVNQALDRKMQELHGSMDVQGQEEATASVHGDHVAKVLAAELTALRTTQPAFKIKFIRAYAKGKLNRMKVSEVRPYKFLAAEKRHAKEAAAAVKKGDRVAAYQHQFQRLVNHYLALEALRAEKKLNTQRRSMKVYQNPKKKFPNIDARYVDAIKAHLEIVDFSAEVSDRRRALVELQAINQFIQEAEENDGAILQLPQWLTVKDTKENLNDMTYGEFIELYDSVKTLEKQGRLAKKLKVGQETRDRNKVIGEMKAALGGRKDAIATRLKDRALGGEDVFSRISSGAAGLDASLLKAEFLLEALDGAPLGIWHQTIYQPFADAYGLKNQLTADVSKMIQDRINQVDPKTRKGWGKRVDKKGLGKETTRLTRESLIMLALNTGNESNLEKTIQGYADIGWNINEELLAEVLDQLSKEEWDLVQSIWDEAEKLWPEVERIYRAEFGVSPDRVERRTVSTKHGEYAGGYFPMVYDYDHAGVKGSSASEKRTALEEMQGRAGQASVNSSMTKGRTGFSAPVNLQITRLTHGLETTIHYITHYDAVRNAKKILNDTGLRAELERKAGVKYARLLDAWVGSIASNNQDMARLTDIETLGEKAIRNTTVAALGFSYTTLVAQTFGLTTAYDRLLTDNGYGPVNAARMAGYLAEGIRKTFSGDHRNFVFEASPEMRFRIENTDRDLRENIKRLKGKDGRIDRGLEFSMRSIAAMQLYSVDIPVWTAAYNYALQQDPGDIDGANAVAYADRVVRMSQSGGGAKDLAAIQRSRGITKAATMFYSFFSALYGILRSVGKEFGEGVVRNPVGASMKAATRIFILVTLQEAASAFIKGKLPEWEPEDEEDESLGEFLATRTATGLLSGIPLVRDVAVGVVSDYGYGGSPAGMFGEAIEKLLKNSARKLEDGDETSWVEVVKPAVIVGAVATGKVPAIQVNRFIDGLEALYEEQPGWEWHDLLSGYDADIAAKRD
ncbi:MAG: hypothetical protein Unbinned3065contig1002_3 [Prokaryotic dsDNA virus sp.]|nr:MAG: hypothetical protein Unbinned3065contig1002_3 [Prokaryotic dsDNA virus sp.]